MSKSISMVVLLLIGLPMMILSFRSYKYFTDETIVIRSALQSSEISYSYSDIECAKKRLPEKNKEPIYWDYTILLNTGETFNLHLREGARVEKLLAEHGCILADQ